MDNENSKRIAPTSIICRYWISYVFRDWLYFFDVVLYYTLYLQNNQANTGNIYTKMINNTGNNTLKTTSN